MKTRLRLFLCFIGFLLVISSCEKDEALEPHFTVTYPSALKVQFANTTLGKESTPKALIKNLWTFGDGKTSTEESPLYTYAAAGEYAVTLTVTDSAGKQYVITGKVKV